MRKNRERRVDVDGNLLIFVRNNKDGYFTGNTVKDNNLTSGFSAADRGTNATDGINICRGPLTPMPSSGERALATATHSQR